MGNTWVSWRSWVSHSVVNSDQGVWSAAGAKGGGGYSKEDGSQGSKKGGGLAGNIQCKQPRVYRGARMYHSFDFRAMKI